MVAAKMVASRREAANAEKLAAEKAAAEKAEKEAAEFRRLAVAPWLCVTATVEEASEKASKNATREKEEAQAAAQHTAAIADADFLNTLPPGVYENMLRSGSGNVRMMLRFEGLSSKGDLRQQVIRLLKHVRRLEMVTKQE